ncbi:hypothetical protein F320042A7_17300 [Blautia producta]
MLPHFSSTHGNPPFVFVIDAILVIDTVPHNCKGMKQLRGLYKEKVPFL